MFPLNLEDESTAGPKEDPLDREQGIVAVDSSLIADPDSSYIDGSGTRNDTDLPGPSLSTPVSAHSPISAGVSSSFSPVASLSSTAYTQSPPVMTPSRPGVHASPRLIDPVMSSVSLSVTPTSTVLVLPSTSQLLSSTPLTSSSSVPGSSTCQASSAITSTPPSGRVSSYTTATSSGQRTVDFTQSVGPTMTLPGTATAGKFFSLLFTITMIDHIVAETNKYAQQNPPCTSYLWYPVTHDELKAFLGTLIAMGIKRLPALADYYSRDPLLGSPEIVRCFP